MRDSRRFFKKFCCPMGHSERSSKTVRLVRLIEFLKPLGGTGRPEKKTAHLHIIALEL